MGSIYCDTDAMVNEGIPPLDKSYADLEDAMYLVSSINIPNDFEYTSELVNISSKLSERKLCIDDIKKWIIRTATKFEKVENKNETILNRTFRGGIGSTIAGGLIPGKTITSKKEIIPGGAVISGMLGIKLKNDKKKAEELSATESVKLGTPEAFLKSLQELHEAQLDWIYSGMSSNDGWRLKYNTTFEDVINNPNKGTCCATYVNSALYLAGYCTEEDLSINGVFNPHYQMNTLRMCEKKEWEKITDCEELQPGDVIFKKDDSGNVVHVEAYVGDYSVYSAGSNQQIQNIEPAFRGKEWYLSHRWFAYRPPNLEIEDIEAQITSLDSELKDNEA